MLVEVKRTRTIKREVELELWARSAGRCEFNGCNRIIFRSPVTQEKVNISEKAHIYSFSEDGPRGWGPLKRNPKALNQISNLMLVCHDCHKLIDQDQEGSKYSAEILNEWKTAHERRIELVTGICPKNRSQVIFYGAKIGLEDTNFNLDAAMQAMFPDLYPAEEHPIKLSMSSAIEDHLERFWSTEEDHLETTFDREIRPRIKDADPFHFSIFALAPQPLLIRLGTLLTDKIPSEIFQLHREPATWKWQNHPEDFSFKVKRPENNNHPPALILSLSAKINTERVTSILGPNISCWEIYTEKPNNDFLQSRLQLSMFREITRRVMVEIKENHERHQVVHIFPAIPVSCALELGRIRMPKADLPWIIYDQNNKVGKFIETIKIPKETL